MIRAVFLSILLTVVWAAAAQAATVAVTDGRVVLTSASDEITDVTINVIGGEIVFLGAPELQRGQGCRVHEIAPKSTACNAGPGAVTELRLGARDDVIRASFHAWPIAVDAGPGSDVVEGGDGADAVSGGDGDDQINGRTGRDRIDGGNGDDQLNGADAVLTTRLTEFRMFPPAADQVTCGAGRDAAVSSGTDRIARDCERVNYLGTREADRLAGDGRDDSMFGDRGNDRLAGHGGRDRIFGWAGRDTISGGRGRDRLWGDAGSDRIDAHDGERDVVRCGSGRDTVTADRGDRVSRDCERVRRARR